MVSGDTGWPGACSRTCNRERHHQSVWSWSHPWPSSSFSPVLHSPRSVDFSFLTHLESIAFSPSSQLLPLPWWDSLDWTLTWAPATAPCQVAPMFSYNCLPTLDSHLIFVLQTVAFLKANLSQRPFNSCCLQHKIYTLWRGCLSLLTLSLHPPNTWCPTPLVACTQVPGTLGSSTKHACSLSHQASAYALCPSCPANEPSGEASSSRKSSIPQVQVQGPFSVPHVSNLLFYHRISHNLFSHLLICCPH